MHLVYTENLNICTPKTLPGFVLSVYTYYISKGQGRRQMNAKQITAAMNFEDGTETGDLIQALRAASDDEMLHLLEGIRTAVRKDTVSDVLADLKSEGEAGAYDLIKSNY